MGQMSCLCDEGDVKITWDPANEEEVRNARQMFDRLKEKGHLFFRMSKEKPASPGAQPKEEKEPARFFDGADGELIVEFDPKAERVVATPPVSGG